MATGSHGVIKTNAKTRKRAQKTRRSTPDSGALDLISKISHLKAVVGVKTGGSRVGGPELCD